MRTAEYHAPCDQAEHLAEAETLLRACERSLRSYVDDPASLAAVAEHLATLIGRAALRLELARPARS